MDEFALLLAELRATAYKQREPNGDEKLADLLDSAADYIRYSENERDKLRKEIYAIFDFVCHIMHDQLINRCCCTPDETDDDD